MSNWGYKNLTRDARLTRANLGQGNGLVFRVSVREFFGHLKDKQPALTGALIGSSAVIARVQHSAFSRKNIANDPRMNRKNADQANGIVFRLVTDRFFAHVADRQPALSGIIAASAAVISRVQTSRWKYRNITRDPRLTRHDMDKVAGGTVRNISRAQFFGNVIKAASGSSGVFVSTGASFSLSLLITPTNGLTSGGGVIHSMSLSFASLSGVAASSSASRSFALRPATLGTTVTGGSSIAHINLVFSSVGGLTAAGSAIAQISKSSIHLSWTGSGTLSISDAAVRSARLATMAVGGLSIGSAAACHVGINLVGSGGMLASSAARMAENRIGTGGVIVSSASDQAIALNVFGGGSTEVSASATLSIGHSVVGAGTIDVSDAAIFVKGYTSLTVDPEYLLIGSARLCIVDSVLRSFEIQALPRTYVLVMDYSVSRSVQAQSRISEVAA